MSISSSGPTPCRQLPSFLRVSRTARAERRCPWSEMKVALAGGASPRSRVTARARVSMPRGGLDRDHLSALEEVGPAVHLRGLDPELRQDRGHLRAMLGAVVDCLQQEQRHGHPPRARRVITGHLDLAVLAGLRRRLLELCVAVSEPLREGLDPGNGSSGSRSGRSVSRSRAAYPSWAFAMWTRVAPMLPYVPVAVAPSCSGESR